tara:strand:- start:169 stop:279 length:111 start_codon:yes stop_codon:yes gene_type:complete
MFILLATKKEPEKHLILDKKPQKDLRAMEMFSNDGS